MKNIIPAIVIGLGGYVIGYCHMRRRAIDAIIRGTFITLFEENKVESK